MTKSCTLKCPHPVRPGVVRIIGRRVELTPKEKAELAREMRAEERERRNGLEGIMTHEQYRRLQRDYQYIDEGYKHVMEYARKKGEKITKSTALRRAKRYAVNEECTHYMMIANAVFGSRIRHELRMQLIHIRSYGYRPDYTKPVKNLGIALRRAVANVYGKNCKALDVIVRKPSCFF